jgi:hypothetical protein
MPMLSFVSIAALLAPAGSITAEVSVPPARKALATDVSAYLDGRQGIVGVGVFNPATNKSWSSSDSSFLCASIIKVGILEAVAVQAQNQGRSLSPEERTLAERMIALSDNDSATRLWQRAGGNDGMADFFSALGAKTTAKNVRSQWGLTKTTVSDQLRVLALYAQPNDTLADEGRLLVKTLLEKVVDAQRWGVSAGSPGASPALVKNGWLPRADGWVVNSIGSAGDSGSEHLLVVLTNESPSQGYGVETVENVAKIAWDYADQGAV